MTQPVVEITESGRGGSIVYREGPQEVHFSWEFAMSPAIVLIFGPATAGWSAAYPWAADRQLQVFETVGDEVIRQRAAGYEPEIDLASGVIEITRRLMRGTGRTGAAVESEGWRRFQDSIVAAAVGGRDAPGFDLAAIPLLTARERDRLVDLLAHREMTWRDIEALAAIGSAAAWDVVRRQVDDHRVLDVRLAALDAVQRHAPSLEYDRLLARQIRRLHRQADGLARALRMAEARDTGDVRQALLWASCNGSECAPACAALLLTLVGTAREPLSDDIRGLLQRLDPHTSAREHDAAVGDLSRLVGMELDQRATD